VTEGRLHQAVPGLMRVPARGFSARQVRGGLGLYHCCGNVQDDRPVDRPAITPVRGGRPPGPAVARDALAASAPLSRRTPDAGTMPAATTGPPEPLASTLGRGPPGLPCHPDKSAIKDQPTRVGATKGGCEAPTRPDVRPARTRRPRGVRRAPRRRVPSLPHCAQPVLAWLAGEDVLAPQPAEGNRHDR
jgi:hypothetical protein